MIIKCQKKIFPAQGVDLAGHGDVDRQGAGGGLRRGGGRGRRPRGQPQLAHHAGDQPRRVPLLADDRQALEEDQVGALWPSNFTGIMGKIALN